jgi:type II secretory pathway component PulK
MYALSKRPGGTRRQAGSVLILVLIVLSSMTALAVGLAYRTRLELGLAQAYAQRVQVHYLALGGIERARALLAATELSPETLPLICAFTATAADEDLFEHVPEFAAVTGAALAYCVRDEQGYFNVNRSDPAVWENLGISRELVSAILDWIDEDDDAGPGGAESDFYSRLPSPYLAKNGPCSGLKELRLVKGVNRKLYSGKMSDADRVLNDSTINSSYPFGMGVNETTDAGLLHTFTVYGDGRINLNTAAPALLAALPGLDGQAVGAVTAWRAGPDGYLGTEDDGVAAGTGDLANIEGLTEQQVGLLAEYCRFESRTFRVFSQARSGRRLACCLMATISTIQDGPQVLYLERLL